MKFKATYANLAVSVRLEGRKPELIQFVNGMFETEDPEIIEALSNYHSDNPKAKIVEFRSDEEPAEEPAKKSKSQQKREKAMDEAKAPEKAEEPVEEGAESAPVEVADTADEPEKKPSKKGSKK